MSDPATAALRGIVRELTSSVNAHLCAGEPHQAVAWDTTSEITVRLAIKGDDELWVIAGSSLLIRFVAASDGDLGDVASAVLAILAGEAEEFFGDRTRTSSGPAVATGYRLGIGPAFAGGVSAGEAAWVARIGGPLAARRA